MSTNPSNANLFIGYCRNLTLPQAVESAFDDDQNELFLFAYSIIEIFRIWTVGRLPDNPDDWMDSAIARRTALWNWEHKDPADRAIAATASEEKITLWHTDTLLKKLAGFPHRYFKNVI